MAPRRGLCCTRRARTGGRSATSWARSPAVAFFEVFGQFLLRLRWVFQLFGGIFHVSGPFRVDFAWFSAPGAVWKDFSLCLLVRFGVLDSLPLLCTGVISCLEMSFSRIQLPEARRTYILALLTMKIQYQQERNTYIYIYIYYITNSYHRVISSTSS